MPEPTLTGAGKTVLVVDDHETTRQTITRMLEAGGFTVRTATNGVDYQTLSGTVVTEP